MQTMAKEAPISFKDGYWKPFSYYKKLFSEGNFIRVVKEDESESVWQIKTQEIEGENLSLYTYKYSIDIILRGQRAEESLKMRLSSARNIYFCVANIKVNNVKEIFVTKDRPDKSTFGWGAVIVTVGDQPLDIPKEFKTITLKKGTKLYRQAKKMEPIEQRKDYYFYADNPLYPFNSVAGAVMSRVLDTNTGVYEPEGSIGASGVYEYALSEDIKIADLTIDGEEKKVWRCNIYSNDPDRMSFKYRAVSGNCYSSERLESGLMEASKRRGCVGFRAYVRFDNDNPKDFDADIYAEVALFGSVPVVRIDCLKKNNETSDLQEKMKSMEEELKKIPLYKNALASANYLKDKMQQELQQEIDRLKEQLEEDEEENLQLEAEVENLKEELEKMRAGGGSSEGMKRKRVSYLHL